MATKCRISGYRLNTNKVLLFIAAVLHTYRSYQNKGKRLNYCFWWQKISFSQYSKSTDTISYYCNSEANLLRKSLMKVKDRVAY